MKNIEFNPVNEQYNKENELEVIEIVAPADAEVFKEKFGPKEYISNYYPENFDIDKFAWSLDKIRKEFDKGDRVDITELAEITHMEHEAIENIAIFEFQRKISKKLLEAFPKDNIKVLDVGGGPTVYQHIAIALEAGSITHSEFLEQNRQEVLGWLNDEEGSHNWDSYFTLIKKVLVEDEEYQAVLDKQIMSDDQEISKNANRIKDIIASGSIDALKNKLKESLGKVVFGDVFNEDLGLESEANNFDLVNSSSRESAVEVITSNFTIESATGDKDKWQQGMINIMNKVGPEGFLSLSAIRNSTWYQVGDEKMPAVSVNEKDLAKIMEDNGFKIMELKTLEGSDAGKVGYDGMIFVFAQKNKV